MEPINVKLVLDNLNQQYANTDLPRRPLSRTERKLLQVLQSKTVRWRNCQAFFNVCLTVVVKEFTTSNYLDFEEFDSLEFEYLGFDVPLEVEEFPTPVDFCFSKEQYGTRCQELCNGFSFIKCAWCKKLLCLKHFLDYHFCEQYIP